MDEQVLVLASDNRLRRLPPRERQALLEFVVGNVLNGALHQLGIALLRDLNLPAPAGVEEAADDFAILSLLDLGKSHFSDRILMVAAKGRFTTVRRTRAAGTSRYEHGLKVRRAYRMVCLLLGADATRFKALAEGVALPGNKQRNCGWDYDRALRAWEIVLRHHRPAPDQAKTKISVSYGPAAGNLARYAQVFRNLSFLETLAEVTANEVTWGGPLRIEMRSCGATTDRWSAPSRTLSICYETADELAALYRGVKVELR